MSKFEVMQDYLAETVIEIFGRYLYINSLNPDSVMITPQSQDMANRVFLDGSKDVSFTFALVASLPLSEYKDDTNADAMAMFEEFKAWVELQEQRQSYPDFENCNVYEITPTQNFADFIGVNQDTKYAEYSFAVTVNFIEGVTEDVGSNEEETSELPVS